MNFAMTKRNGTTAFFNHHDDRRKYCFLSFRAKGTYKIKKNKVQKYLKYAKTIT